MINNLNQWRGGYEFENIPQPVLLEGEEDLGLPEKERQRLRNKRKKEVQGKPRKSYRSSSGIDADIAARTEDRLGIYFENGVTQFVNHCSESVKVEFKASPKETQRPRYPKDGNRGFIKDGEDKPLTVRVMLNANVNVYCAIFVYLSGKDHAGTAKHFETYVMDSANTYPCFDARVKDTTGVVYLETLSPGVNIIALEAVGIRRMDNQSKTRPKLEKNCAVICAVVPLENDSLYQAFQATYIQSSEIKCEQPSGPPSIKELITGSKTCSEGQMIVIKGGNLISSSSKSTSVEFSCGEIKQSAAVDERSTKDFLICFMPYLTGLERSNSEQVELQVSVVVDDRRSEFISLMYQPPVKAQADVDPSNRSQSIYGTDPSMTHVHMNQGRGQVPFSPYGGSLHGENTFQALNSEELLDDHNDLEFYANNHTWEHFGAAVYASTTAATHTVITPAAYQSSAEMEWEVIDFLWSQQDGNADQLLTLD